MTLAENDAANNKYQDKVMAEGAWITKEFITEVLSNGCDEDVQVTDFQIAPAVGVGENYLSFLYRTQVHYKTKSKPDNVAKLMIKGAPSAKIMLDIIAEMGVFDKEINMYSTTLPAMQKLFDKYFPNAPAFVAPLAFTCSRENTIVMEDLKESGYKMADRHLQLDFEHCKVTLKTLARYHALGVKLKEINPEAIEIVGENCFFNEINREKMSPFLLQCFRELAKVADGWEEHSRFADELRAIGKHIWDKAIALNAPSKIFNVLTHGDMWVNNFMYKFNNDGSLHSAKLLDFQLSRIASPVIDILYFLFTSTQPEVLKRHMQDLLKAYHEALTSDLKTLDLDVTFTFDDLQEELRDHSAFAVLVAVQILPIIKAQPADVLDVENIDLDNIDPEADSPMEKNYRYHGFRKVITQFFEHLEAIGYFKEARTRLQSVEDAAEAREQLKKKQEAENKEKEQTEKSELKNAVTN